MMMSLTICLINFALLSLNFNAEQAGAAAVPAHTRGAYFQHPQLIQENVELELQDGAQADADADQVASFALPVSATTNAPEESSTAANDSNPWNRTRTRTQARQSSSRPNASNSEWYWNFFGPQEPATTTPNQQDLNLRQKQKERKNVGGRPGAGAAAAGSLIFTWDPNEFPEIPFADDDNDGDNNDVTIPSKIEPKQFGDGGQLNHYYYCGPRGRASARNCARLCRSLNYPRVSCARNSCYCTW